MRGISVGRALRLDQERVEQLSQTDKAVKEFKYLWRRYGNWDQPRSFPIIAYTDATEEIVGFHAASFGRTYVNSYYQLVVPEVKGRGVGGMMVSFLLAEADRLRCPRLKFKVPYGSEGQAFWEGFGLRPFGRDGHHFLFDVDIEGLVEADQLRYGARADIPEREMDRYRLRGIELL